MYIGGAGATDRGANGGCEADHSGGRYGRADHGRGANNSRRADYGRCTDRRIQTIRIESAAD